MHMDATTEVQSRERRESRSSHEMQRDICRVSECRKCQLCKADAGVVGFQQKCS
jgi:hypothetical protein